MIPILRPCWNRPEMLRLSLEYQEKNLCGDQFKTYFFVDYPQSEEVLSVIDNYNGNKEVILRKARLDLTPNILTAYRYLFGDLKANYVAIIEDDIIISKDWLKMVLWFTENDCDENVLAFNAGTLMDKKCVGDMSKLKYIDWYYSCASVISKRMFDKYMLPHCCEEYYNNKDIYLRKNFPGILEGKLLDQAGLFRRVRMKNDLKILCPVFRRFGHIGVYGRFQGESPFEKLSTEERYNVLKKICHSGEELSKYIKCQTGNFVDFEFDTDFNKGMFLGKG